VNKRLPLVALALLLAACGSKPRQPDWLLNADSAQDRFERAYLQGRDREAAAEFGRFRTAVSSTAHPDLVARAELTRCAATRRTRSARTPISWRGASRRSRPRRCPRSTGASPKARAAPARSRA
jgi:hypothetical protein